MNAIDAHHRAQGVVAFLQKQGYDNEAILNNLMAKTLVIRWIWGQITTFYLLEQLDDLTDFDPRLRQKP